MEELTNSITTLSMEAKKGISSEDTAIITYPNGTQEIIKASRPIFDRSQGFIQPEAYDANGNHICWHRDGYVEAFKKNGTHIFWWEPPSIQDVVFGRLGKGVTAVFNQDGSIQMKRRDGMIWNWGVPIEMETDDAYEAYDPPEPCERCRSFDCYCGKRDW